MSDGEDKPKVVRLFPAKPAPAPKPIPDQIISLVAKGVFTKEQGDELIANHHAAMNQAMLDLVAEMQAKTRAENMRFFREHAELGDKRAAEILARMEAEDAARAAQNDGGKISE